MANVEKSESWYYKFYFPSVPCPGEDATAARGLKGMNFGNKPGGKWIQSTRDQTRKSINQFGFTHGSNTFKI